VTAVLAAALVVACLVAVNRTPAPLNLSRPGPAIAFAGLLLFAAAGVGMTLVTLRPASRYDALPIAGLATATVAVLLAVVVVRYPLLVPPSLTLENTVAPPSTIVFLAVGIGLNVPLLLFYNWFAQRTFRGKLTGAPDDRDLPTPAGSHQ
jgi:cytochrome d ubiquinol oxidase subunit II